ncbi:MAG: hypothetical protein LBF97_08265 [Elusimicrobiota bacterium]|jgi:hypothetical protein|nr:hypothetical protein [Elusimicrobiota bacterium]
MNKDIDFSYKMYKEIDNKIDKINVGINNIKLLLILKNEYKVKALTKNGK